MFPAQRPTWHNINSYGHENTRNYLANLTKGSLVYVEAQYEVREPEVGADPASLQGQRQHFLRHGSSFFCGVDRNSIDLSFVEFIRVLKRGQSNMEGENEGDSASV
jgi:hypothetical protein